MESFRNITKKIVIFSIIFIAFPVISIKINSPAQNLTVPNSDDSALSSISGYIFAQSSEQVDPFYQKLFDSGKYYYDNGNYSEAIENLEIAYLGLLDHPEKLLECYVYLTVCHYQIKNLEKSKYFLNEIKKHKLEEFLKTIKSPKSLLDKYYEIDSYFSRLEAKPKTPSSPASEKKPGFPSVTSPSSRDILEAEIKRLKESIKNDKQNSDAYFRLSEIYLNQEENKKAKSVLEDLIDVDEKNGNAYFELGKIYVIEKEYYQALNQFRKAALHLKDDIELHYHTAKVYYELKQYQRAKSEFLKVQEINETYKDTEKYLALIEEKIRK